MRAVCSRYRGHGAILCWELLNEARPNMDPVSMGWSDRAAKLVRSVDNTHLICSGAEGFLTGLYPRADAESGASPDLSVQNLHPDSVDIVSCHLYPKYLDAKFQPAEWRIAAALAGVAAAAGGRPVIVGEWGTDPRDPQPEEDGSRPLGPAMGNAGRRAFMLATATCIGKLGLAGSCVWSYAHKTDESFGLSVGDPEAEFLLKAIRARL